MLPTFTFIARPSSIFNPVFTTSSTHRMKYSTSLFRTEPISKCNDKSFSLCFCCSISHHQTKSQDNQKKQLVSDRIRRTKAASKIWNIVACSFYSQHSENSFKHFWMLAIYILLHSCLFLFGEIYCNGVASFLETFQRCKDCIGTAK